MEVIILIILIVGMAVLVVGLDKQEENLITIGIMILIAGSLMTIAWVSTFEKTETEASIHQAVTQDNRFSYYTDGRVLIPVPENVVKVIRIEPRWGSLSDVEYKIVYD